MNELLANVLSGPVLSIRMTLT